MSGGVFANDSVQTTLIPLKLLRRKVEQQREMVGGGAKWVYWNLRSAANLGGPKNRRNPKNGALMARQVSHRATKDTCVKTEIRAFTQDERSFRFERFLDERPP